MNFFKVSFQNSNNKETNLFQMALSSRIRGYPQRLGVIIGWLTLASGSNRCRPPAYWCVVGLYLLVWMKVVTWAICPFSRLGWFFASGKLDKKINEGESD